MDRLISEQELLKHFDPREDFVVVQTIKAIPSADEDEWVKRSDVLRVIDKRVDERLSEPKWIPVSERLPEADGRYLCTYEDDIEENCVDFGNYKNGEWYVDKVIAWMALPKTYEPQERSE